MDAAIFVLIVTHVVVVLALPLRRAPQERREQPVRLVLLVRQEQREQPDLQALPEPQQP